MNSEGRELDQAKQEKRDVDVPGVFLTAMLLLLFLGLSLAGVWGVSRFLVTRDKSPGWEQTRSTDASRAFPEPRLETVAGPAYANELAAQKEQLNSYGWVDRAKGVAHIPIARAMQIIVKRGLPEVGSGQTRLQLMQAPSPPRDAVTQPSKTP